MFDDGERGRCLVVVVACNIERRWFSFITEESFAPRHFIFEIQKVKNS
jgi:hypothetical protein